MFLNSERLSIRRLMRGLTVLALGTWAAFGQTTMPLSLRKSIEIAMAPDGNTRLAIAAETIAQADSRRLQARAALLPNVDGSVSYQNVTRNLQAFGIQFPSIPGLSFATFVGPFGIFDARANVNQSIVDLSVWKRYQAARGGVEASRLERESLRSQITDQVARAYLSAIRADSSVETARANVELAEALRKLAESQKTAGTGLAIEVTRAEVQLANDRQRLQVAENERNRAHLQLLRAMDLNLSTELQLTDRLGYLPVEPVSFEQALQSAVQGRPDLKAQQQRETVARLNYSAVRMERLPSVGAFGDYGPIGSSLDSARATRTVGVSVRVPIFDGGRRDARRVESASQMRQEQLRTKDIRQQLELELRVAFDNLRSAELQVKTAEEGATLAQRELDQAQRRYRAGITNSIEVTDAQTRLARARENRTSALFQHNLSRLDLGSAMGAVERYLP